MLHGPLRPRIKGSYMQAALRGGILARQNGFSVDTEVRNSEVVTF